MKVSNDSKNDNDILITTFFQTEVSETDLALDYYYYIIIIIIIILITIIIIISIHIILLLLLSLI